MKPNPFERLPTSITVGGQTVEVNSDFRVGISIEMECSQPEPDIAGLLMLFYRGNIPSPVEEAGEKMIEFFANTGNDSGNQGGPEKGKRVYDFEQDADALSASFLGAYGLDLSTASIHWWEFRRLLCNLPPETPFMRRMYYRTADLKKLSKSERKHVEKMRRLYALKQPSVTSGKTAAEMETEFKEKMLKRYEEAQNLISQKSR